MIRTKKCSRKNLDSTEGNSINIQTLGLHITWIQYLQNDTLFRWLLLMTCIPAMETNKGNYLCQNSSN